MVRSLFIFLVFLNGFTCFSQKEEIETVLQKWHAAAAKADFDTYFSLMSSDAVFIGTDATENWTVNEFKAYAKPHFDKGKAWNFTAVERHIFSKNNASIAWFDELLDTQLGICRGSGVMEKKDTTWKIKHYVLSITIPNKNVGEIKLLNQEFDETLLEKLRTNK